MNCLKIRSLLHCALMLVPAIGLAGLGDIQSRIDEQVKAGGGRVTISAGTWVTGPIRLASNIELHLEKDAVLEFPDSPELYWDEASATMRPLVGALCSTNVSVTGSGTLLARADYWHGEAVRCKVEKIRRPIFIQFQDCRDVRLEGFRVRNSPAWTVHMLCSDNVVIRGLDMRSCGYNNDGIDLESVQGAVVEDCYIDAGDDAICMKSGKNEVGRLRARQTKDVLVRNCTVVNGHTLLAIGSELSGGIENIRLESCKVLGEVWRVLFIKTNYERGGYARNITVKGVKAARAKCAIFEITNGYSRWRNREKKYHTEIENVTVEDVVCEEAWRAYELVGDPEMPAKNITVRNCELKYASRGDSIAKNIEGLVVENVRSKADEFSVWCDDPDSLYECGAKAVFNVHSALTNGIAHVRLDNFGSKVLREFDVDLSKTRDFTVEGGRDIPGFLLLTVTSGKTVKRWGAAFSPEKISGGAPRPDDFVKFWYDAVRDYDRKVREDVKLERVDSLSTNGCSVYLLSLSDPKGRKVYGFLKEPSGDTTAPYPVNVTIPGAGPSSGTPAWKGGRKNIELMMNVHYYRPVPGEAKRGKVHNALQKEEDEYYNRLYPVAKNPRYTLSGIASSREDYFYYGAILAINRAVNWLRRRPNVNPGEFTYSGGSQGGGMGLALVAINGKFKKAMFGVPALTAHLCHLIDGRMAGWPRLVESQKPENQAAAIRNAPYFDGVNFASMITCPVAFSVGYTDTVAPPHAGYAAFNACTSRDKAMFGSVGFGHKISQVDSARMRTWLENCGKGMKMLRVDLRTARVVCCNTNDADSVMAAAELEKHLNMVAGERTPQADGFVFAVGEKPLDAPPPKVFESCARVDGKRLCFWGEAAEHGVERSRGPLFAVYEFLDKKLGVKWTYPGDENTVFQSQKEVQLQEGESWSFTPPFEVCSFRSYPGAFKRYWKCPTIKEFRISRKDFAADRAAMELWYLRMRLASRNRHDSGHNFTGWQRRFLKDHPEWFAYIEHPDLVRDGKPGRGIKDSQARRIHGCYSCPTLPQAIVDDWVAKGAPRRMNLCLNDGKSAFCHCQECLKLDVRLKGEEFEDHLTDRVVYFYNKVVPLALKVRPDVDVCAYIYSMYHKPPRREKLLYGDHMTISYVAPFLEKEEVLKQLEQWYAAGLRRFYLRPNYMCYDAVFPRGLERYLFDNFKMSVKFGAIGVMYDGTPRPVTDLEYYTICSLAQRPEREFDEILDEFLSRFGKAAPEARAYFAHVRARSSAILAATQSLRKLNVRNMLDDSELGKFAAGGHTLADLEAELAILKPGLEKTLAPADALRFKRLVLRAENSVLTFRFLLAGMGKDDAAFQAAADRLFAFRLANLNDLGRDEGQRWTSLRNFERPLWERSSHKPPKLPPKR